MEEQPANARPMTQEHSREINRFLVELKRESPRCRAILALIKLDELALEILRTKFVGSAELKKDLLGVDRPLGPFSARVRMLQALGLIRKDFADVLLHLGRMRNDCAHRLDMSAIEAGPAREMIRKTAVRLVEHPVLKETSDTIRRDLPDASEGLADFILVIGVAYARLMGLSNQTVAMDSSDALRFFVPPPTGDSERTTEQGTHN